MKLVEIVPAQPLEHRRAIRRMAADAIPMNPITMALIEIAYAAVAGLLFVACAVLFVRWWTM